MSERVRDDARGFALTVPAGFVARPDLVDVEENLLRVWSRPSTPQTLIVIKDLGGLIPFDELLENKPAGVDGQQSKRSWRGYQVEAFEVREKFEGNPDGVTFNVEIPLRSGGVRLGVFGPASQAKETEQILESVLASFDGESNWPEPGAIEPAPEATAAAAATKQPSDAAEEASRASEARGASDGSQAMSSAPGFRGQLKRLRATADGRELFVLFGVVIVAGLIVVVLVRRASTGRL